MERPFPVSAGGEKRYDQRNCRCLLHSNRMCSGKLCDPLLNEKITRFFGLFLLLNSPFLLNWFSFHYGLLKMVSGLFRQREYRQNAVGSKKTNCFCSCFSILLI